MQNKRWSVIESIVNTLSGFIIAWVATLCIIPLYTAQKLSPKDGFEITVFFTIISLARNYYWRRIFTNRKKGKY